MIKILENQRSRHNLKEKDGMRRHPWIPDGRKIYSSKFTFIMEIKEEHRFRPVNITYYKTASSLCEIVENNSSKEFGFVQDEEN